MKVGELSKRSGIPISTIHFYETKNLIRSSRDSGNQRVFHRSTLRLVSLIKYAQNLGFTLDEIKDSLRGICNQTEISHADWEKLNKKWEKKLEEKISKLNSLKNHISTCIGCGCLSQKDCPVRNADDYLGKLGPGAHLLS